MTERSERERFGPFAVFESVGSGGMASVDRATLDVGGRTIEVALKRLLPGLADDPRFVDEFIRETRIAAQLEHLNIVHVVELGCLDGVHYIAMELLRGATLAHLVHRASEQHLVVPIPITLAVVGALLDALDYAQNGLDPEGARLDLVHRDISPSNVFVTEGGIVKVIDFGVAKMVSGRLATSSGLAKGKIAYMAREAIAGDHVDARADLFSLGVLAWELIAGRRLFPMTDDWITPRPDAVPPPSTHAPRCPRELDALVLRALARDRDARWPTAAAMRAALRALPIVRAADDDVAAWQEELVARTVTRVDRPSGRSPLADVTGTSQRLATADIEEISYIEPVDSQFDAPPDARFDKTPFDDDDRFTLGEPSPFATAEVGVVDLAHAPTEHARPIAPAPFDFEPTAPSKEIVITHDAALPPPPDDFSDVSRDAATRDASVDTIEARRLSLDTQPTAPRARPSPKAKPKPKPKPPKK